MIHLDPEATRWLRRQSPPLRVQSMRVAILPSGALLADTPLGDDETTDGLSGAARVRVARAFARGSGHALLALGATELEAPLTPPLAFTMNSRSPSRTPSSCRASRETTWTPIRLGRP
jgi:hypothetical protein